MRVSCFNKFLLNEAKSHNKNFQTRTTVWSKYMKTRLSQNKSAAQPTSSEGLGQHLGGEGGLGAAALPLLRQVFAKHVPPPAVQETV